MNIGEIIKSLRKEKKVTQKQLANLTGLAEITIRQYEANKYEPKIEQLQKIADALNVNINELLIAKVTNLVEKGKQAGKLPDSVIDSLLATTEAGKEAAESSKESLLILNYRKLNPEGKTEAVKRVEELTEIKKYTE